MDLRADGDGDGVVDRDDFIIWKWTYGNAAGGGATANEAVPEPSTALLAGLFALLVVGKVRKLARWR
jgi:hypothetical protein